MGDALQVSFFLLFVIGSIQALIARRRGSQARVVPAMRIALGVIGFAAYLHSASQAATSGGRWVLIFVALGWLIGNVWILRSALRQGSKERGSHDAV